MRALCTHAPLDRQQARRSSAPSRRVPAPRAWAITGCSAHGPRPTAGWTPRTPWPTADRHVAQLLTLRSFLSEVVYTAVDVDGQYTSE
jgi:hypothetical protein